VVWVERVRLLAFPAVQLPTLAVGVVAVVTLLRVLVVLVAVAQVH